MKLSACLRAMVVGTALTLAVSVAGGQSYGPEPQRLTIGAPEFRELFNFEPYLGPDGYVSFSSPGDPPTSPTTYWFSAHVSLPEGATIDEFCLWANDGHLFEDVRAVLLVHRLTPLDRDSDLKTLGEVASDGAAGYRRYCTNIGEIFSGKVDFEGGGFVEDADYHVDVGIPASAPITSFGGVQIVWRRTVSTAPTTPSFGDVPASYPFYQFIEALAASGITGGCGAGNYCPDAPIKRGQMAVFLSKALGLHWPTWIRASSREDARRVVFRGSFPTSSMRNSEDTMPAKVRSPRVAMFILAGAAALAPAARAQMIDRTQAPNALDEGIAKSLAEQVGAGRGDWNTSGSSSFLISRDPFRAIRRGRQLFQRKFTRLQLQGPGVDDGLGDIDTVLAIGAGLSDSCASCHGRPRGSAGGGGDVVTRPESRDAIHLFGLGLKEMLADEMTRELRVLRDQAKAEARRTGSAVMRQLYAKGVSFGAITARPDGSFDESGIQGVDRDLRVRPFFAHGGTMSIREFVVGALRAEMGLEVADPDTAAASSGRGVTTPSGMVLDGRADKIEAPPVSNPLFQLDGNVSGGELPTAIVDYLEFYLLNYFKPATYKQTDASRRGLQTFRQIGCASCHVPELRIEADRRVADVETVYDPERAVFNGLFATASPLFEAVPDASGLPPVKRALRQPFQVRNIFTDFKRHDLGPAFHERNWDGTTQKEFLTRPLWGVGSKIAFGHDGRSVNLAEVILRHGGEAQKERDAFAALGDADQQQVVDFLRTLVLFPPDDTASNLDPGDPTNAQFPQMGHGSIRLTSLFNDPSEKE